MGFISNYGIGCKILDHPKLDDYDGDLYTLIDDLMCDEHKLYFFEVGNEFDTEKNNTFYIVLERPYDILKLEDKIKYLTDYLDKHNFKYEPPDLVGGLYIY